MTWAYGLAVRSVRVMDLDVTTYEHGPVSIVTVAGEIDHATAPRLRETLVSLAEHGRHRLVIDLRGVDFMDSTALGLLAGALKRSWAADGSFRLVCTAERLLAMFRVTGLDRVMAIRESVDQALADQDQCS